VRASLRRIRVGSSEAEIAAELLDITDITAETPEEVTHQP
jgi:hypothetical protein